MFSLIEGIINGLQTAVAQLGEDILFFAVVGINVLLGIILLFSALSAYGKTVKKIQTAIASENYEEDFTTELLPRGANALIPLAVFFFAAFAILCPNLMLPLIGLMLFELFNFVSRLIYGKKSKKAKKLFELYNAEHSALREARESEAAEERPRPKEERRYEPAEEREPPKPTPPPVQKREEPAPVKEEPVSAQRPIIITPPPVKETTIVVEPKPEPKTEPVTSAGAQKPPEKESTSYQPFEPRRPVTQQPEYNIERASGYTVPRPPEPAKPAEPVTKPAEPAAEKKPETNSTIDSIVERINQIKREGATRQTMTELSYIIQKEREKNENKNPAERQRLSEALSELLKTMNKSNQ